MTGQTGVANNGFGFQTMAPSMPGVVVNSFPSHAEWRLSWEFSNP